LVSRFPPAFLPPPAPDPVLFAFRPTASSPAHERFTTVESRYFLWTSWGRRILSRPHSVVKAVYSKGAPLFCRRRGRWTRGPPKGPFPVYPVRTRATGFTNDNSQSRPHAPLSVATLRVTGCNCAQTLICGVCQDKSRRPSRLTDRALSCVARPPTVAEAPKVDARMLPDLDWSALCNVSCSALLGGRPERRQDDSE